MHVLLDNLAALIVGGMVLAVLLALGHRSQASQVQTAGDYSLREQQVGFIETLRRDLLSVVRVHATKENASDSTFAFTARLADSADTTVVIYKRVRTGTKDGRPLYQVRRFEDTAPTASGHHHGGSPATLTEWSIRAQNAGGSVPANPGDARQVWVRFKSVVGFGADTTQRHWEATFRPRLMRRAVL